MNALRLFPLTMFFAILLASPALRADMPQPLEQRMLGMWQALEHPANVVQFFPDHTLRLYLTKRQGGPTKQHWYSGTWKITPEARLLVDLAAAGGPMHKEARVVFSGEEMSLVDDRMFETRHRRIKGELPKEFNW